MNYNHFSIFPKTTPKIPHYFNNTPNLKHIHRIYFNNRRNSKLMGTFLRTHTYIFIGNGKGKANNVNKSFIFVTKWQK